MADFISRRGLLAAGAISVAGAASPSAAVVVPLADPDPRLTAEGQVKLTATLDGTPAFWTYSGVIYAVQPDRRPIPLVTLSGGQSSWAARQPDGAFRVTGVTLTFFRDPATGAFLDSFDNPITGKRNPVQPNLLVGGAVVYPADGGSAHAEGRPNAAVIAPEGFGVADPHLALGALRWSLVGPSVLLMTDRSWNVAVQPQLEAQSQTGDRAAFFDPRLRQMPARYTATTIMPWMTWLEMAGVPGHLVWHSSGEKVFKIEDMAEDYRLQAAHRLEQLTSRPA